MNFTNKGRKRLEYNVREGLEWDRNQRYACENSLKRLIEELHAEYNEREGHEQRAWVT